MSAMKGGHWRSVGLRFGLRFMRSVSVMRSVGGSDSGRRTR